MEKKMAGMVDRTLERQEKQEGQERGQRASRKLSEYGRQLHEKQRVKEMYGMRERQFRRFFQIALRQEGVTGESLLSLLERRLDNAIYRLKMATTRTQARQMIVHGHILVNGKRITAPSYIVEVNDTISLDNRVFKRDVFLETVVDKRMKMGIKVPEWLELNKQDRKGIVLRYPIRADIQVPIEEHLIVELYSK
jgi:small subunit ribosomal protein S4